MLDGHGEPSTDPREYYTDPSGSLLTAGAHKGYGLSLAVEILGGILSGTGRGQRRAVGLPQRHADRSASIPARFLPLADFHAQVAALFELGARDAAGRGGRRRS